LLLQRADILVKQRKGGLPHRSCDRP
jgi:hypothetical protein